MVLPVLTQLAPGWRWRRQPREHQQQTQFEKKLKKTQKSIPKQYLEVGNKWTLTPFVSSFVAISFVAISFYDPPLRQRGFSHGQSPRRRTEGGGATRWVPRGDRTPGTAHGSTAATLPPSFPPQAPASCRAAIFSTAAAAGRASEGSPGPPREPCPSADTWTHPLDCLSRYHIHHVTLKPTVLLSFSPKKVVYPKKKARQLQ